MTEEQAKVRGDYISKNIESNRIKCPDANVDILLWIFRFTSKIENSDYTLHTVFLNGYCYYFAHMLKHAFGVGRVMFNANQHFVYVYDDIPYDVKGVNLECEFLIPEEDLGDAVNPYKHRIDLGWEINDTYEALKIDKYRTVNGRYNPTVD